jgi:hypothetical protein
VDNTFGNLAQDKFLTVTNDSAGDAHFTLVVNF